MVFFFQLILEQMQLWVEWQLVPLLELLQKGGAVDHGDHGVQLGEPGEKAASAEDEVRHRGSPGVNVVVVSAVEVRVDTVAGSRSAEVVNKLVVGGTLEVADEALQTLNMHLAWVSLELAKLREGKLTVRAGPLHNV